MVDFDPKNISSAINVHFGASRVVNSEPACSVPLVRFTVNVTGALKQRPLLAEHWTLPFVRSVNIQLGGVGALPLDWPWPTL